MTARTPDPLYAALAAWMRLYRVEHPFSGPDAPGHCHSVPGRWDDGRRGACHLCTAWAEMRRLLAEGGFPDA